jgi:Na+/glutamate symporter
MTLKFHGTVKILHSLWHEVDKYSFHGVLNNSIVSIRTYTHLLTAFITTVLNLAVYIIFTWALFIIFYQVYNMLQNYIEVAKNNWAIGHSYMSVTY